VREAEEILSTKPSEVRLFALVGALTGLAAGFAFTVYTVKAWPLMVGGKPIVSIPAFLIIAFALTILFGSLSSFLGFLCAAKLPAARRIASKDDCTNEFEILADVVRE
jgi:ABC-type antimicrobial peptide transport system permease subunit